MQGKEENKKKSKAKRDNTTCMMRVIVPIAALLVCLALASPWILSRMLRNDSLGIARLCLSKDTISGIMSPFIGVAGLMLTFLAFYIQKRANDIVIAETERKENKLVSDISDMVLSDLIYTSNELKDRIDGYEDLKARMKAPEYRPVFFSEQPLSMYKRMAEEKRDSLLAMLSSFDDMKDPALFLLNYYSQVDTVITMSNQNNAYFSSLGGSINKELNSILDGFRKIQTLIRSKELDNSRLFGEYCMKDFAEEYDRINFKDDSMYDEMKGPTRVLCSSISGDIRKMDKNLNYPREYIDDLVQVMKDIKSTGDRMMVSYSAIDGMKDLISENCTLAISKYEDVRRTSGELYERLYKAKQKPDDEKK